MNATIAIFHVELGWTSTDVSLFIPVTFKMTVYACYEDVVSEIEFTALVEQRVLDVGLDYVGFIGAVWPFLFNFYDAFYLLEINA